MSDCGVASPMFKPPFPPGSSLVAHEDLILPAGFNDLHPPSRELQPLRIEHQDEVRSFLHASFDLSRFRSIRKMLWLIAIHGAPRSLNYQTFLRREIVIAEELDLHLVWAESRIFVKPLPDFLLNYHFWETHISCDPELYRAACGLLYSYCGLIRYNHDLQLAKESRLLKQDLDYRGWSTFTRTVLPNLNANNMDERFQYGELRLNRLDIIYRCSTDRFSLTSVFRGFPHALTESYVPFMDRYNTMVSAFGVIVIVMVAFNLAITAHPGESVKPDLRRAAYGSAIFAMVLCVSLMVLFIVVPFITLFVSIYRSILTRKRHVRPCEDKDLA